MTLSQSITVNSNALKKLREVTTPNIALLRLQHKSNKFVQRQKELLEAPEDTSHPDEAGWYADNRF